MNSDNADEVEALHQICSELNEQLRELRVAYAQEQTRCKLLQSQKNSLAARLRQATQAEGKHA